MAAPRSAKRAGRSHGRSRSPSLTLGRRLRRQRRRSRGDAAALGERPYTFFAGHFHTYSRESIDGREYYILATTGGASDLGGVATGEFDHIMWVTVTANGPVVANVTLEGLYGNDPASEETARQARRPSPR